MYLVDTNVWVSFLRNAASPYDLQIAAIALAHRCTLVTHNVAEFQRVPGLTVEDWESG